MFHGFKCSDPRDFLLFLCTKFFALKIFCKNSQLNVPIKGQDYTYFLINISSAACSRQLHCHNKCHFPSLSGFSASIAFVLLWYQSTSKQEFITGAATEHGCILFSLSKRAITCSLGLSLFWLCFA